MNGCIAILLVFYICRCDQPSCVLYKFIDEPDDELKCMICLEVAEDPLQHETCGKLVCKECIEKYGREKPCPNCRREGSAFFTDNRSKLTLPLATPP